MSLDGSKRKLTCIVCPIGCVIEVNVSEDVLEASGYRCGRGLDYARQEAIDPRRIAITVVKVRGGDTPIVPVKTDRPIPKKLVREVAKLVAYMEFEAPIELGQILVEDILGTGANLVATRPVKRIE
jgi:CxxC motif-containing protein